MPFSKLTPYEFYALNQYLCEIPEDKTFNDIVSMIDEEHEDIIIWDMIEMWDSETLIEQIKSFKNTLEENFIPRSI